MKFAAIALCAGIAAAVETVTVSHFLYVGVNGYPQLSFKISVDDVSCAAEHFVVGGTYPCDDPAWTFKVVAEQGRQITLSHTVEGHTFAGDFAIRLNGPIPTVLDQIGTSTADLDKETTA